MRTRHQQAVQKFYSGLLGWTMEGHAHGTIGRVGDRPVAMIGAGDGWDADRWFCFFATPSIEAELVGLVALGGQAVTQPAHTEGIGRSILIADPQGAHFGLMERDQNRPAATGGAHGTLHWCELDTADPAASLDFYRGLFGYAVDQLEAPTGAAYTRLILDAVPVAGVLEIEDDWPGSIPPRWLAYFAVDDIATTVRDVQALGGTLVLGPLDSTEGHVVIARDPAGGTVCLAESVAGTDGA
jgi:predicted enzyme related to lactoylglutathione lyase